LGRPREKNNKLDKFLKAMVFWPQNLALFPFKLMRSSWKTKEERKRERLSEHQNPKGNHRD
jgi:hypothetical protein